MGGLGFWQMIRTVGKDVKMKNINIFEFYYIMSIVHLGPSKRIWSLGPQLLV